MISQMERLSLAWQRLGVSLGHDGKQPREEEEGKETNNWRVYNSCAQVDSGGRKLKSWCVLPET